MEGYLQVFVKKRYVKYWCVLDGQQLTYYERLDLHQQQAVGVKGTIFVKNADIQCLVHETRPHVIRIKPENRKQYEFLDCEKGTDQSTWFQCLSRAAKLHEALISRNQEIRKYVDLLKIDPSLKLSRKVITRAYRKLCLKAHPDKGGEVSAFSDLCTAYDKLMAIQSDVDARERSDEIEYEAIVEKGPDGVGLGLMVNEDLVRQRIVVQQMKDNIILKGLTEEAGGTILPNDSLVGIDKDDCLHWPLSRIRARLNAFRLPVGGTVHLRLQRRITSPEDDLFETEDIAPESPTIERHRTPSLDKENEHNTRPEIVYEQGPTSCKSEDGEPESRTVDGAMAVEVNSSEATFETVAKEQYRMICIELEKTKLSLREAEKMTSIWKDRAESAMEGNGMLKTQLSEMREIVDKLEEHAFAKDTEIKYLKSRVESFEAAAPSTASSMLQLSRHSSEISLEEVFKLKNDRKAIENQLLQLRYYSCRNHESGNISDGSLINSHVQERSERYREIEARAEEVEAELMSMLTTNLKSML